MPTQTMTNAEVLATVMADNADRKYVQRAKGSTNPEVVLQSVLEYANGKNEFLEDLINRIGETIVSGLSFENPLKKFKKRAMMFGDAIQDIYVGRVKRQDWNPNSGSTELFTKEEPDLSVCYHEVNRQDHYDVTVTQERLRQAFTAEYGLSALIAEIVSSPITSNEIDEFEYTKKLLNDNKAHTFVFPIEEGPEAPRQMLKLIKKLSKKLPFPHDEWNSMGSLQTCPLDRQALILPVDVTTDIDMDVLAALYHLDKASIENTITEVDDFIDNDILGYMADERAIQIRDFLLQTESFRNPGNLSTKLFFHVWELFGYSLYGTLIAFGKASKFQNVSIAAGQESATIVNGAKAYPGSMVVIKVDPEKVVQSITYGPSGTGSTITIDSSNNQAGVYTFPMPTSATQVKITYAN